MISVMSRSKTGPTGATVRPLFLIWSAMSPAAPPEQQKMPSRPPRAGGWERMASAVVFMASRLSTRTMP